MKLLVVDQFGNPAIRERLALALDTSGVKNVDELPLSALALGYNVQGFAGLVKSPDGETSDSGVLLELDDNNEELIEFLDYFYTGLGFSKQVDNTLIPDDTVVYYTIDNTISDVDSPISDEKWISTWYDAYDTFEESKGSVEVVEMAVADDSVEDDEPVEDAVEVPDETMEDTNETDEPVDEANEALEITDEVDEPVNESIDEVDESIGELDEPVDAVAEPLNEAIEPADETAELKDTSNTKRGTAKPGKHKGTSNLDKEIDLFSEYKVTEAGWWSRYKVLMAVLAVCFVGIVGFGAYTLISYNLSGIMTKDLGERVASQVTTVPVVTTKATTPATNFNGELVPELELPENISDPEDSLNLLYVKFDELREKYPDVTGWLCVPGAGITQPVAQTSNNEYYLTHNIDKTLSKSGWLFADYRLSDELPLKNYIIYGHNMADGTAFGMLNRIRFPSDTWDWWTQPDCQLIYYTTEYYTAVYQIFNVMQVVSSEVYYHNLDLHNSDMVDFMTDMSSRNMCADKLTYSNPFKESDRIITLSTCADAEGAEKLVIQGVLVYSKQLKDAEVIKLD